MLPFLYEWEVRKCSIKHLENINQDLLGYKQLFVIKKLKE